jgi:DNA-binding MarR family transcriptional regulator
VTTPPPPAEIPRDELIRAAEFRTALRRFLRRTEITARAAGLTPQRYVLLLAQSTVTELVIRAERQGLVEREISSQDARVARLRVTPEGRRRMLAAFVAIRAEREELLEAFGHAETHFRASFSAPGDNAEFEPVLER